MNYKQFLLSTRFLILFLYFFCYFLSFFFFDKVFFNVLKTGPVTEPEKLPVHGSLVGPMVEPWLNR